MSDRLWSGSGIKMAELKNYGFGFVLIYFGRTKQNWQHIQTARHITKPTPSPTKKLNNIKQACLEKMFV